MPDTTNDRHSKPSSDNFSQIPLNTPRSHKTTPKLAAEFYRDDSHFRRRYGERKREKGRQRAFNDLIEDETRDYSLDIDAYCEDSTSDSDILDDDAYSEDSTSTSVSLDDDAYSEDSTSNSDVWDDDAYSEDSTSDSGSLDDDAYSEYSTSDSDVSDNGSGTNLQSYGPTSLEPTPTRESTPSQEETRLLETSLLSPANQSASTTKAEADVQVRRMTIETDERLINETFSALSQRIDWEKYCLGAVKNILGYCHSMVELGSGMIKPFCSLLGCHPSSPLKTRDDQSRQTPSGHTSEEIPDTRCTKPAPRAEALYFNRTHWSCCHPCQDAESGRCGFGNTMGMSLCHRDGCNHVMCEACEKPWVVKPLPDKRRRTSGVAEEEEEPEGNEE